MAQKSVAPKKRPKKKVTKSKKTSTTKKPTEKGDSKKENAERGRPTPYKEEYAKSVFKLCLLGAKDKEIAEFYEVTETTINNWKKKYPDFFESIKKGKLEADSVIAESLYQRAKGALIRTQKAFKVKVGKDANGGVIEDVKVVTVVEEIPAGEVSMIFWLKNRHPDKWRDKIHNVNLNGEGDDPEFIKKFFGMES